MDNAGQFARNKHPGCPPSKRRCRLKNTIESHLMHYRVAARLAAAMQQIENCGLAAWAELANNPVGALGEAACFAARCKISHVAWPIRACSADALVMRDCGTYYGKTVIDAKSPGAVPDDNEPR
jgi:hypothetical protein